ncbi:hypothetical protein K6V90_26010 [Cupriavidus pauculus]|uniref:hypothetical protein n=1 Tax=Cupriavidus pauculus TaxID=82633 RepID=UPI001C932589|nr:hypothetical protein [Cupriavidus pauculus]MBY4733999.1 hypothetical protein [Cupriavidus pauculus]
MGTFARIHGGKVVELFEEPDDGFEMKDRFHPALVWVDVTTLDPLPAQGWAAEKSKIGEWTLSPPQ